MGWLGRLPFADLHSQGSLGQDSRWLAICFATQCWSAVMLGIWTEVEGPTSFHLPASRIYKSLGLPKGGQSSGTQSCTASEWCYRLRRPPGFFTFFLAFRVFSKNGPCSLIRRACGDGDGGSILGVSADDRLAERAHIAPYVGSPRTLS